MSWVIERPDLDRVTQSAPRTRSSPRRTHTKSKNGCQACKKRRIKCDETTPACGQCRDKNTTCIYPIRTPTSTNREIGQSSATAAPATVPSETSVSTGSSGLSNVESTPAAPLPPPKAPPAAPQAKEGAPPPASCPLPSSFPALNPGAPPPQQDPVTDSSPMPLELAKARIMMHLELVNVPCTRDANFAISPYRRSDVPELLDHFVATHIPWAGSPECQRVMQTWAPTLAVTNVFLLHGLLAFSASHLRLLRPWDPKYASAASLHYGLSLSGFATSLGDSVGRANADALFACCYLHAMLAFHNKPSPAEHSSISNPADFAWLRLMKGIPILQRTNVLRPHLNRSLWLPVFVESGAYSAETGPLPNPTQPLTAAMSSIESLRHACAISPIESENESNPYATPLAHLDKLSRVDIDSTKIGALMVFIGRMPEEFVVLLEKLDRRAMLILAMWCEFAGGVEQWWCQRPAREECARLRKVAGEQGEGEGLLTPESMG